MKLAEKKQGIKRLAIYYFYDADGIVDDYVLYLLNDLRKNISELWVVCNGKLTPKSREKLEKLTPHILVRENRGFDAWAYKAGMDYFGWDNIVRFDEVVLTSCEVFGPLFPLKKMFEEMNKRDMDFWGITLFNGSDFDLGPRISQNIPPYIQSYFQAIRKNMLLSAEFHNYWENLPEMATPEEAVRYHEAVFTNTFEKNGFSWQVYIDTREEKELSCNPILYTPLELVKNKRCPFIKRQSFFLDYEDFLIYNNGESTVEVMEYISRNLDYDTNMIWDNILRTQNQSDIKNCLHLTYILPSNISEPADLKGAKIALVLHLFYLDLLDFCFRYASSMPKESDIYITTDTEEKRQAIQKVFQKLKCNALRVMVIDKRGRDVSSLLVAIKEFVLKYDYVCFVHTKKSSHMSAVTGASWRYQCFENLLRSGKFVENIIHTFEQNPRLGILVPPPPSHGEYYSTIGIGEWSENFENVVKLAQRLNLNVPIEKNKEPIAPLGSMFWFRPKAMKVLYEYDWIYLDFPEGSLALDGTLQHAIERIHPFVAQHEGYYPAWVMSDSFARMETTNLYYMLRKLNKELFQVLGPNSHLGLLTTIKSKFMEGSGNKQEKDNHLAVSSES